MTGRARGMSEMPPWTPINTPPLLVEIKATHSTCSSPRVNVWFRVVAQPKPCRESRVELSRVFSRALEVVSEIEELLYLYFFIDFES
jgi:hypothetical protein